MFTPYKQYKNVSFNLFVSKAYGLHEDEVKHSGQLKQLQDRAIELAGSCRPSLAVISQQATDLSSLFQAADLCFVSSAIESEKQTGSPLAIRYN